MYAKVLTLWLSLLALSDTAVAQQTVIDIQASGYSQADVLKAVEIFRSNCKPLGDNFWADVVDVHASVQEESAFHRLKRGWMNTVHLAIRYADRPGVGPAYSPEAGVIAGHTLHYDLGGGSTPGFLSIKRSSQYLCGVPVDQTGSDVFSPVPDFSILDR